mmetsp:Transcript_33760/g.69731  ORF Transcript_33760/g.69731 Transcript_33760/m.69731 type:complete len:206 (-) Transcript_33760:85-702(-)
MLRHGSPSGMTPHFLFRWRYEIFRTQHRLCSILGFRFRVRRGEPFFDLAVCALVLLLDQRNLNHLLEVLHQLQRNACSLLCILLLLWERNNLLEIRFQQHHRTARVLRMVVPAVVEPERHHDRHVRLQLSLLFRRHELHVGQLDCGLEDALHKWQHVSDEQFGVVVVPHLRSHGSNDGAKHVGILLQCIIRLGVRPWIFDLRILR